MDDAGEEHGPADTSVELEEADDLIDVHFAIVNDEERNLEELCGHVSNLDGRFLDDLDPQHLNMTPLALASALNRPHLCRVLLRKGANVDATFANLKTTALMTSSFHGHPEVVRALLEAGANPKLADVQQSTALGYCFGGSRQEDVVKQLLEAGVDVNVSNVLGMNAFLLVSGYGNPKLLNMVLNAGAKVTGVTNNYGHTPLHLALLGKLSQVNQLTRMGTYNTAHYGLNRRNLKQTFVEWAKINQKVLGRVEVGEKFEKVGQLMEALGEQFITTKHPDAEFLSDEEQLKQKVEAASALRKKILMEGVSNKKTNIIDSILSCGGKLGKQAKEKTGKEGPGAPMERLESEPQNLPEEKEVQVEAICENFLESVAQMLKVGCEMEKIEHTFALTPLDIAILNGDVESTALLLSKGADPDHLMSTLALSDLYQSISALRPDKKHIKDLLEHDKHLNVNHSFSAAHIPTRLTESEIEDMIGDSGLTAMAVATKCRDNSTTEIIKMLAKHGADINGVGVGGRTPLGEACRWGNVKMVEFLIGQGADLEQPNPALKMATPIAVATISRQPAIVQFLISKGAKIDKEMSDKRTPLISAIDCEDMAMVDKLLQADPVLNCHNNNSLDHQMIKLYQSPTKDIRVILQEISKRAAEIKAEEEEDEDAHQRSSRQPEIRASGLSYPVYDTILPEEVHQADVKEKASKVKKIKKKKGAKVEENESQLEGKQEVVEPLIVAESRRALEPLNPELDMPIYASVNKMKKSSKKHAIGSKKEEKEVKMEKSETTDENDILKGAQILNEIGSENINHVEQQSFPEYNKDHIAGPSNEHDASAIKESPEHKENQLNHGIQQLEDALKSNLLEAHEFQSAADDHAKSKKKKIKKKLFEAPVEEAVKETEKVLESATAAVAVSKKKVKKKVKDVQEGVENGEENVIKQEVVHVLEPIVDLSNEENIKPKSLKKKKSPKKKEEEGALTDEVTV